MKSVSISLLGNEKYRDAVGAVAKKRRTTAGAIVREALERQFGSEINEALVFFEGIVDSNQQSKVQINDDARK